MVLSSCFLLLVLTGAQTYALPQRQHEPTDAITKEQEEASSTTRLLTENESFCDYLSPSNVTITILSASRRRMRQNARISWNAPFEQNGHYTITYIVAHSSNTRNATEPLFTLLYSENVTFVSSNSDNKEPNTKFPSRRITIGNVIHDVHTGEEIVCWIKDIDWYPTPLPQIRAWYGTMMGSMVNFALEDATSQTNSSHELKSFSVALPGFDKGHMGPRGTITFKHPRFSCPAMTHGFKFSWKLAAHPEVTYTEDVDHLVPMRKLSGDCTFELHEDIPNLFQVEWVLPSVKKDCRISFKLTVDDKIMVVTEGQRTKAHSLQHPPHSDSPIGVSFVEYFTWEGPTSPESVVLSMNGGSTNSLTCKGEDPHQGFEEPELELEEEPVVKHIPPMYGVTFIVVLCIISVMAATMLYYVKKIRDEVGQQQHKVKDSVKELILSTLAVTTKPLGARHSFDLPSKRSV